VSVDTYLKGKNTSGYRRHKEEDLTVLLAPALFNYADKVELVTRKNLLFGIKLIAIAHHEHTARCRH
jgi:hypothetical protein